MATFYLSDKWRPFWSRQTHPLVRQYLRKPLVTIRFSYVIGVSAAVLFLFFGGFSLPMLYFLFSLIVLLQIAISTGDKIHLHREGCTWDLVRITPFTLREVLLSLWMASIWQLHRTWIMFFYRLLQGIVVIGVVVYALLFAEIPASQWFWVLVCGTLVIAVQPFADMYYSGMMGLLSASLTHDRAMAQVLAVAAVLVYWVSWLFLTGLVLLMDDRPGLSHMLAVLTIPLLLPACLGYCCFKITERLSRT